MKAMVCRSVEEGSPCSLARERGIVEASGVKFIFVCMASSRRFLRVFGEG